MIQPIYIEDEFKPIVKAVSDKLMPVLSVINPGITAVHYDFGHPLEIVETLTQKQDGVQSAYDRYPLIALFLDIPEKRGQQIGIYTEYTLHMAIIAASNPEWKAFQRLESNFKPILIPIYLELMNQISMRGDLFQLSNAETVPHNPIKRYYWGREGLPGMEGRNIFNDAVDCVEIQNLKLKVNINYCPKPAI